MRHRSSTPILHAAWTAAAMFLVRASLLANCGSATCPMDPQSLNLPLPRQFTLDFSFQYIDQDQVRIGTHKGFVGEVPSTHDEIRTVNRGIGFLANYAISDQLVLSAFVPFVSRYHEHIEEESAQLETWHFSDLGDVAVSGRYRLGTKLWTTLSVKFPTGARHPENSEAEAAEVTLAPGSGSIDVFGGFVFQTQLPVPSLSHGLLGNASVMPFFAGATYRRNGRGTESYRMGDELLVNAGLNYPLFTKLQLIAQINADFRGKDDVGDTDEDPNHTGRTSIFISPGLRVGLPGGIAAYWVVQIPVYQRVNGIQLTARQNLLGGIQARF